MGVVLALFGTIIPPLLMNAGFPTGIGLGSIVSALELPVSVTMAFVLLRRNRFNGLESSLLLLLL
jgi:hypothetical protein